MAAFKLFDVIIMIAVFIGAALIVSLRIDTVSFDEFLHMRIKIENFALFLCFMLLWHLMFSSFGLYRSRRFSGLKLDAKDVLKATTAGTFVIFFAAWIFKIGMATPLFLLVFWTVTTVANILTRLSLRGALKWLRRHGRNVRFVLIVGSNERAIKFARKIESQPDLGYRFLGFVDEEWDGNGDLEKFGWKLASDFHGFSSYLRLNVVDEVVIALPMQSLYRKASQIFSACEEQGIIVRSLTGLFNPKLARSKTESFEGEPLISHYTGAMGDAQVTIKRVMDMVISAVLLVILSPLALVTAVAIKINSPGPVHFIQERVGLNKRRFRLYKFRSMVEGADQKQDELEDLNEVCGPVFKIKNDPRITFVGMILRKTSIDELPQLFNVLKGDMSLVGPRPLPVRDYNGFDEDWHRRRFSVRPGITCLWQVNGRSSIPFEKWMELDMEYIDNWTLGLDLNILIKTVPAVLKKSGAA
jgi:exopolysaccharide biosynthesis polyprenyl glycosylphosphotransferase